MSYLSIIEKFKILFDMILDFKFIFAFVGIILISTFLYLIKKIDNKKYILTILLSALVILIIDIIINYKELSLVFDNFMTIFFSNIYFPSIYVYIATIVIISISFIVSILNKMLNKAYKVVSGIAFIMNNILFVIVLNIIAKNKIDVFTPNSLYTNVNLVAILEISIGLFILWILSLIVIYTTSVICDRISRRNVKEYPLVTKETLVTSENENLSEATPVTIDNLSTNPLLEVNYTENIIDNSYSKEEVSDIVYSEENTNNNDNIQFEEESILPVESLSQETNLTFEDILNGMIPVNYYDNNLTLEVNNNDYNIINPQEMYEKKYNEDKNNSNFESFQDIANNINDDKVVIIKENKKEEIKVTNNEPLNSELESSIDIVENNNLNIQKDNYTLEDYKKVVTMLDNLKKYTSNSNISIDEAVTISLINNNSIDDCLMFKEILENNLN